MLRLDKVIKPWKESASLNDHINLYGFWNETALPYQKWRSRHGSERSRRGLRKSGPLRTGVRSEAVGSGTPKRLAQPSTFYQYLFKSNRPDIPFATYDDPIVEAAIDQRKKFFEAKRDHLYQVEIFYCILLEGARSKTRRWHGASSPVTRSSGSDRRTQNRSSPTTA